ncbi:ribonuclease regulator [Vibrio panuliri]|uniref:Ribonuclease regulator n=1 Tax=Vibrio panuliri TaxID=1381081 RepID=A0A1Q9H9V4_9VIBR|nr:ribonuclease regulator [Vibrio panuliri]KAB1460097.1 ribonuclease regulator [Vibrio panuliri]OLQ85633.1 ribonuclease regulator [Vibrio panuliri]OLQ96500.1 ribonuclease regulator [Vibrio panuliri]
MKKLISLTLALLSCGVSAADLPKLQFTPDESPHRMFLSTDSNKNSYDSWTIESGYAYSLFDKVDVYVGTRMEQNKESGFLSGLSYQISPKLSLKSSLHSYTDEKAPLGQESGIAAEVSSRVHLTEHLDLHATLDYQEWQQGFEVGIGFRF